ncbi:MAG: hypothetical protein J6U49_02040 [Alistipes sp.]|nr:hypothetical protein [Alistipes sp.]
MKKLLKLYDDVASFLAGIAIDKWLHFIFGIVIAAVSFFLLDMKACIAPVIVAAIVKECIDEVRYGGADLADFAYTVAGGAIIQLLCLF